MRHRPEIPADLPARDDDRMDAVIEAPKGSLGPYGDGHDGGAFRLDAALPEGVVFPRDVGFRPSTPGADGAQPDLSVSLDARKPIGRVTSARLIRERHGHRRAHDLLDAGMARATERG